MCTIIKMKVYHEGDFNNILLHRWHFFGSYIKHKRKVSTWEVRMNDMNDMEGNNIHTLLEGYFILKTVFINYRLPLGQVF